VPLNPNAKVPLLITPDGPIYESAATMMYLSEQHDGQLTFERYFPREVSMQQALKSASLRSNASSLHIESKR
jgi:glutathione S-transferase